MVARDRIPKITILGIGNTLMGDDGVGVVVVKGLLDDIKKDSYVDSYVDHNAGFEMPNAPNVNVVVGETAGMGLVKHFRDSDVVIVVDSISTGAEPGTIFRFNPDEAGILCLRSNNIHGMGVSYLVTNARLAGANPEVIIFGVQIGDVHPRDNELTPPVSAAVNRVRELVLEQLESLGV